MALPQEEISFAELERNRLIEALNRSLYEALEDANNSPSYPAKEVVVNLRKKYVQG